MERRTGERERGGKKEVKKEAKWLGSIYVILLELKAEREAEESDRQRYVGDRQTDKGRLNNTISQLDPMTSTNYFIQQQGGHVPFSH